MAVNANGQFQYPESPWSQGRMRKRGQRSDETQVASDYRLRGTPDNPMTEMDRAAGLGIAARGGARPGDINMRTLGERVGGISPVQQIENHKDQIQEVVNGIADGDATPGFLKKILKKFGWGDQGAGKFTDPTGGEHTIEPTNANGTQVTDDSTGTR